MKRIFALLLISLCTQFLYSQTKSIKKSPPLESAEAKFVGLSSERLERLDVMLEKAIADQAIPGAVALVARKGKIVYFRSYAKPFFKARYSLM